MEQRRHEHLKSLPEFQPRQPFRIYYLHRLTSFMSIFYLIDKAQRTREYTIDTEGDPHTQQRLLVQIEFIQTADINEDSIIVLVELNRLPWFQSKLFHLFQRLFCSIFYPENRIFTWDNQKKHVEQLISYQLFNIDQLNHVDWIDLQVDFKFWYNRRYKHDRSCQDQTNDDDHPQCTCEHRPYKWIHQRWSLQLAVAHVFGEHLDKTYRKNNWHLGVDPRWPTLIEHERKNMIKYAVNECLSVTKLKMFMEEKGNE